MKEEQEFQRRLTLYAAIINLRIVHQRRVAFKKLLKSFFLFITAKTSTLTQATHQTDDDSPQSAIVNMEGVPVTGIIDTGSDINSISKDMFKTVIPKAGLKKEEFKTVHVDKQAFTYNKQCITFHGWIDTNMSFEDKNYYLAM